MSGRISWLIRGARSAARRRGIPFDRVLPYAEVALGALLGLACGALLWGAAAAWLFNQSAEQALAVSAGGGRDAEAARRVAEEVADRRFQEAWQILDASGAGLGGSCRLLAGTASVGDSDTVRQQVVLRCEGRPGRAVAQALAAANRRVLALEGRLTLLPPGYETKHSQLLRQKAGLEEELARIESEQAELKTRRPQPAAGESDDGRLKAAQAANEEAERRWSAVKPRAQALSAQLEAWKHRLDALGPIKPLDPARLERERADLEGRLRNVNRQDCTAEHPLVRRLEEIDRHLQCNDLSGRIAEGNRQLAEFEILEAEARRTRRELAAAKERQGGKEGPDGQGRDPEAQRLNEQWADKDRARATVKDKLAALEAIPPTRIAIRPAGQAVPHPPAGGAPVLLLAMALGAGLALLFHFKVAPGFSLIDDRDSLAEKLQVPVLGVVPRLAALERR